MKELEEIVNSLKDELQKKEEELQLLEGFSAHTQGHLNNRRNDIEIFEVTSNFYLNNSPYKEKILKELKQKSLQIIEEIKNIAV